MLECVGVQAQPALRLHRPVTLEVAVGQATELVEKVILHGRLATTASVDASRAQRKPKPIDGGTNSPPTQTSKPCPKRHRALNTGETT